MPRMKSSPDGRLVEAIQFSDLDAARKALENGADPNMNLEDHCQTPLTMACSQNRPEIVSLLIDAGADVNKPSPVHKFYPLNYASHHGFTEIVRILLERGADPTLQNGVGETSAYLAASQWHRDALIALMEYGVDISKEIATPRDSLGEAPTVYAYALMRGWDDVVSAHESMQLKKHPQTTRSNSKSEFGL